MNHETELELMLLYVAGVADADEAAVAEALLCAAGPAAQAAYAEAMALFHAMPLCLECVELPPDAVRDAVFGRISAESGASSTSAASVVSPAVAHALANERSIPITTPVSASYGVARWPLYVASGLAAALAVALTMTLWNGRELADRNRRLADRTSEMSATLAGSENVLRSSHVTLASLSTTDKSGKPFGRVLFCPVTRQYQITVFGLSRLPAGKAYELWLITPDQRKVPAGVFDVSDDGTATVIAHPAQSVDIAALAAVTDEPAGGSAQPTGSIHLAGALQTVN